MKPFEVLCIRKDAWKKAPTDNNPSPAYLEVCMVTGEKHCGGVDLNGNTVRHGVYYQLAGYNPWSGFHSAEFIRLPDTSADEMQEQEREGIVNLENVSACQK